VRGIVPPRSRRTGSDVPFPIIPEVPDGSFLRDLRQGVDGRLQPAVVRLEPGARASPLPAEPPADRAHWQERVVDPSPGLHALPAHRDEVRPLGPTRRANLAHRVVATALGVAGLIAFAFSPLLALILFGVAFTAILDRRGVLGRGRWRAMLAFIAAPFIGLAGVALALLGAIPAPGNFFLLPGLLLVGIAVVLLAWSFVVIWRTRARTR
jgi:hypothetical protein